MRRGTKCPGGLVSGCAEVCPRRSRTDSGTPPSGSKRKAYEGLRDETLSRLPRDPDDWQVVALALFLGVDILTSDEDFFGCGVATWTMDTLISQLDRRGQLPLS